MKTLGRVLIILAAFSIVMGITYLVVTAGSSSTSANTPAFDRAGGRGFRTDGVPPQFSNDVRREFDGPGRHGGGWMFGMLKNAGVIAVIVALIAVPKSLRQKRIRRTSASMG